jgi:predicted dithiol-disulfide oxidoreductase (DUF899 family)
VDFGTLGTEVRIVEHRVVSHDEWIAARTDFLAEGKEFTHARDALSRKRQELPWEKVEKTYVLEGPNGRETLSDLFEGRSQLIVYHFMFLPEWDAGCPHCSFWADNFNDIIVHLNHRDVTMVAISRAVYKKLDAYRQRMGWSFKWLSASDTDFNHDLGVSFSDQDLANRKASYNYGTLEPGISDREGTSVFFKDESGDIFHTYSTYARGIDMTNTAYHYLDLVPKGRDEGTQNQYWVRRHDEYE